MANRNKTKIWYMRITQSQISLCIRVVWSELSWSFPYIQIAYAKDEDSNRAATVYMKRLCSCKLYCWFCQRPIQMTLFWAGHAKTAEICGQRRSWSDCASWSGSSLSANRLIGHNKMYEWRANARMWFWISAFCACSKIYFRLARPIQ